jgi:hypothetical protein
MLGLDSIEREYNRMIGGGRVKLFILMDTS